MESTWLDFVGAAVDSVDVDGASIPVEYDGSRIVLRGLGGSNVVRVAAHGHYSRSGEGLHRFVSTTLTIRRICTRNTSLPMPGVFSPASSSRTSRRPSHSR